MCTACKRCGRAMAGVAGAAGGTLERTHGGAERARPLRTGKPPFSPLWSGGLRKHWFGHFSSKPRNSRSKSKTASIPLSRRSRTASKRLNPTPGRLILNAGPRRNARGQQDRGPSPKNGTMHFVISSSPTRRLRISVVCFVRRRPGFASRRCPNRP